MKFIVFDKEINNENISELINSICDSKSDVIVYFESSGGDLTTAQYFIDFSYRHDHEITLISMWEMSSSALDLFLFSKTRKIIKNSSFGTAHVSRRDISTVDLKNPSEEDSFLLQDIEDTDKIRNKKYLSIGLTKKESERFLKGEDVFLNTTRIEILSKNAEKLVFGDKK